MACTATARPTLSLHISLPFSHKPKPKLISLLKTPSLSSTALSLHKPFKLVANSIDVSKDDKPSSDPEEQQEEEQEVFDKRRLEEKFAVLNTGIHECRSCGYKYDEAVGDATYPVAPGMPFEKLPEDWRCPTCGAAQSFFESKSVEIAGFAQNQQFGLGGNALTGGQKTLLIYGSLLFFFALFLSGYFLQ